MILSKIDSFYFKLLLKNVCFDSHFVGYKKLDFEKKRCFWKKFNILLQVSKNMLWIYIF